MHFALTLLTIKSRDSTAAESLEAGTHTIFQLGNISGIQSQGRSLIYGAEKRAKLLPRGKFILSR